MKTEKLFEKYGQKAKLKIIGEESTIYNFKAFIQPLRYKNKLYLRGKYTEIGKNREDYYLYIGPPDIDISGVDGVFTILYIGEESYLVYRAEKHNVGGKDIYVWAIIRPVTLGEDNDEGNEAGGGAVG